MIATLPSLHVVTSPCECPVSEHDMRTYRRRVEGRLRITRMALCHACGAAWIRTLQSVPTLHVTKEQHS